MAKNQWTSLKIVGQLFSENSRTSVPDKLSESILLVSLTTSERPLWWRSQNTISMEMLRKTTIGHTRSMWSHTMSMVGLMSTRTISRISWKLSQSTQRFSRYSVGTRLPNSEEKRGWWAGLSHDLTRLVASGAIPNFSSSIAEWMMTSNSVPIISTGSNSGIMESSQRLLWSTRHQPWNAHSSICSRKQA